jgi:hypothetical protein
LARPIVPFGKLRNGISPQGNISEESLGGKKKGRALARPAF